MPVGNGRNITKKERVYLHKKARINLTLNKVLKNSEMNQKGLAIVSKTPAATLSDHISGREVTFDKAVSYAIAFEKEGEIEAVNELTSAYSYNYLGFLKSMDGELAEVCTTAELEIFQKMESSERKERKHRAEMIIVQSKIRHLDQQEFNELQDYALEFLDEIIVELAIVFSILKIINLSIQEAIGIKMPEWIRKKYMKG